MKKTATQLVDHVANQLAGIHISDLTTAERNIAEMFQATGRLWIFEEHYRTEYQLQVIAKRMRISLADLKKQCEI